MSERISKEEARQLVRAKSAEHNKVDSSTEHGAIASSVAAILSKKGLASTYQKEVKSLNLSSAKRFIHKLVSQSIIYLHLKHMTFSMESIDFHFTDVSWGYFSKVSKIVSSCLFLIW